MDPVESDESLGDEAVIERVEYYIYIFLCCCELLHAHKLGVIFWAWAPNGIWEMFVPYGVSICSFILLLGSLQVFSLEVD